MNRSCYSIEEGRQGAGAEGGWRGTGAMFTVGRSEPQGRSTATTTERRALKEVSGGAMFTGGRSMVRSEAAAPESHAPEDGNGDVLAIAHCSNGSYRTFYAGKFSIYEISIYSIHETLRDCLRYT